MVHSPKVTGNLTSSIFTLLVVPTTTISTEEWNSLLMWPFECVLSCPIVSTLRDPMDHSLAVHGILQARIPKYSSFPIAFPRGSSRPRDWTPISCISSIPPAPPGEPGLPQTHRDSVLSITQYTGGHELLTCRSYSLYRYTEAIIFITVISFQHLKSENFLP